MVRRHSGAAINQSAIYHARVVWTHKVSTLRIILDKWGLFLTSIKVTSFVAQSGNVTFDFSEIHTRALIGLDKLPFRPAKAWRGKSRPFDNFTSCGNGKPTGTLDGTFDCATVQPPAVAGKKGGLYVGARKRVDSYCCRCSVYRCGNLRYNSGRAVRWRRPARGSLPSGCFFRRVRGRVLFLALPSCCVVWGFLRSGGPVALSRVGLRVWARLALVARDRARYPVAARKVGRPTVLPPPKRSKQAAWRSLGGVVLGRDGGVLECLYCVRGFYSDPFCRCPVPCPDFVNTFTSCGRLC